MMRAWMGLLGCLLGFTAFSYGQKHWDEIEFPPLRPLPQIEPLRFQLPNGIVVYLVEDRELPLVEGRCTFWGGDHFDPGDKVGLATIAMTVMRTGGTQNVPGEEMDAMLEDRAVHLRTFSGSSLGWVNLSVLTEDLDFGLETLNDVLRNPAFPQDKLDLAKKQVKSTISRRNDDVTEIAAREFSKMIYGPDSVQARVPDYEDVDRISREDLVQYHRRFIVPDNVMMGFWGDFDAQVMKKKIEHVFSDWPTLPEFKRPNLPPVTCDWEPELAFVQKSDVAQSQFRIGHLGRRLDDPDYAAMTVAVQILGSGMTSRLFEEVRTKRGLAYTVYGSWSPSYLYPGRFFMAGSTKFESTVEAIQVAIKTLEALTQHQVTPEELSQAKDGILNSFVFQFNTKEEVLQRMMRLERFGYPLDFLQSFQKQIQSMTAEDVLRAARNHLRPDALRILVVGKQQELGTPLTALGMGEPKLLDVTIPLPETPDMENGAVDPSRFHKPE